MTLNHEALRLIGELLYGPKWKIALGDAIGVNRRTIARWAKGEFTIPDGVWSDLIPLCRKRIATLAYQSKELSAWLARLP